MAKSLLDIDVYTFGHLLKYLRVYELCSVASSHPHLRDAARFEFARRYTRKEFIQGLVNIDPEYCDEGEKRVIVYSIKFILQFLRCFGDLIDTVTVSFVDDEVSRVVPVISYLCLYCYSSLKKLTMSNLWS